MSRVLGKGNIIPGMRYRDAPAAIEWLCNAFGFSKNLVVPGPGDTIAHAQLILGDGMIMLGSVADDDYGRMVKTPQEAGGNTQCAYVVAGAEIVMEIADQEYGGGLYSAKYPEGYLWNFGSYDPWSEN